MLYTYMTITSLPEFHFAMLNYVIRTLASFSVKILPKSWWMLRGPFFKPPSLPHKIVSSFRNFPIANSVSIVATSSARRATPTVTRLISSLSSSDTRRLSKAFGFEKLYRQSIATMATTLSPVEIADLEAQITAETDRFNELRQGGGSIEESKKTLAELKKALNSAKNAGKEKREKVAPAAQGEAGASSAPASKKKERLLLKTAKVRDTDAMF